MMLSLKYLHLWMSLQFPNCPIKLSYNSMNVLHSVFLSDPLILLSLAVVRKLSYPKDLIWVFLARRDRISKEKRKDSERTQ